MTIEWIFPNTNCCPYSAGTTRDIAGRLSHMHSFELEIISIVWWRHQMEIFSALLVFCAGNSPGTGEFPAQRPVTRSFDVFFMIWAWTNIRAATGDAGDLRRNRAHYDVIVVE